MGDGLSNELLRSKAGNGLALAEHYRNILPSVGSKVISDHLIENVRSGALPPGVFSKWLDVCDDPDAIVAAMTQTASAQGRRKGIEAFGMWLRSEDGFHAIWNSAGGVEGILRLMADMSVNEVDYFCKAIRRSSGVPKALEPRREAMSALFGALSGIMEGLPNPDKRPLKTAYEKILPACTPDVALAAVDLSHRRPSRLALHFHLAAYEAEALDAMFPSEGEGRTVGFYDFLIGRDWRFALTVLQRLAEDNSALERSGGSVIEKVAIYLLRRLCRTKKSYEERERALRLVVDCVRRHPPIAEHLVGGRGGDLIFYAVRLWNKSKSAEARSQIEEHLVSLLSAVPSRRLHKIDVRWLKVVNPQSRFRLLRLILLHAQFSWLDIEARSPENDQKFIRIKSWNYRIFMVLPKKQALELLEHLVSLHPDDDFLDGNMEETMKHLKPPVRNDEYYAKGRRDLEDFLEKAASGRQASYRSTRTTLALSLAVEMESLDLFRETILWARRFIRDPLFTRYFYSGNVFSQQDTLHLLSGIALPRLVNSTKSQRPLAPTTLNQLCGNIVEANKIVLLLYETASMGLREPSFSRVQWRTILNLPLQVVKTRMERAHRLQELSTIEDTQLWEFIWAPTIEFLLELERFNFEHGGAEALGTGTIGGPLGSWERVHDAKPTSYIFLDELAKRRDEIWCQARLKRHPGTADLGLPWPKGLPIQALTPYADWSHMPYVQGRADAVVFMKSSAALEPAPENDGNDNELPSAIGPFVDSYKYALKVYVQSGTLKEDRQQRIRRAWNHAVTELTGSRMHGREIPRFWKTVFDSVLRPFDDPFPSDLVQKLQIRIANLPAPADNHPVEWNPEPDFRSDQEQSRPLSPVVLDCMLSLGASSSAGLYGNYTYSRPSAQTVKYTRRHIFHSSEGKDLESLAPAALAYINTKYGRDKSFLLQPFPSQADVRIPAFYLDQDFLEIVSQDITVDRLLTIASSAPIPLLDQLAKSVLARLEQDYPVASPDMLRVAIGLIQLVSCGDRPAVACDLIRRVIIDHQDDSSWHRHLIKPVFLRTLGPRDARAFFAGLSSEIQTRLIAQQNRTRRRKGDNQLISGESGVGKDQSHYVKVTTVKLVAQMLHDATYFDPQLTCDVLSDLLTAQHVDVRIAVINSLINMLDTGSTLESTIADTILDAIEHHVVPIASALNEAWPEIEDDWLEAESGNGLPRVTDPGSGPLPPILELLVNARERWEEDTPDRCKWVSRILAPIVETSAANNSRWTELFLTRYKLAVDPAALPTIPAVPGLLLKLFADDSAFFTKANFEIVKRYIMAHILVPDFLQAANKQLIGDDLPDTELDNDVQHWVNLWWPSSPFRGGLRHIITRLKTYPDPPIADYPSVQSLQQFILEVADAMIVESNVEDFETLIDILSSTSDINESLLENCIPVLETLIHRINNLRTPAWQRDAGRKPKILPDTLNIKMAIFRQKHTLSQVTKPYKIDLETAVADITALITDIVEEGPLYHEAWQGLKKAVTKTLPRIEYANSALALATPVPVEDTSLTLADLLKCELADDLLREAARIHDVVIADKVLMLLRRWAGSPVERMRLRAFATAEDLDYSLT